MLFQSPSPELYQAGEEYQLGEPIGVYKRYATLPGRSLLQVFFCWLWAL
jgi:hypothetical protein